MFEKKLQYYIAKSLYILYKIDVDVVEIKITKTRSEFEGDFTFVVFPFLRFSKKGPEQTAKDIGDYLKQNMIEAERYNLVKGFLNIKLFDKVWFDFFKKNINNNNYGFLETQSERPTVIEFSSPNTNKPLHLGHIRNNLLGFSLSRILQANGKNVVKVNLINDRGIHICKSMLAYKKWGNNINPEKEGIKGDEFVGELYVKYNTEYKKQVKANIDKGIDEKEAKKQTQILKETHNLLQKWENNDKEVRKLWQQMNEWVYKGFNETYKNLGVNFDKLFYESNTYLLGKDIVNKALKDGIFYKKADNSVWIDLFDEGLDEKLILRADGTSVYITQDLGTAVERQTEYDAKELIYVVGNEQNYHFQVLKESLKKLSYAWYKNLHHYSYGMVELPDGKMKSREGNVVDADDFLVEMFETARDTTLELGKIKDFTEKEFIALYKKVGLSALKYFILKVDPKKTILFNPQESIDFNGNTGPFIQYTYARIQSVLRKAENNIIKGLKVVEINKEEKEILQFIYEYPEVIKNAADNLSPALIANFSYNLSKSYNRFYHNHPILNVDDENISFFRIKLSAFTAEIIKSAMWLLGIDVPERM